MLASRRSLQAGIKYRAIGARAGLPWRSDQRLEK
jgi:hypothetical protein